MIANKYLYNLQGSPYINEAGWIDKLKNRFSKPVNSTNQTSNKNQLNQAELDFLKIVDSVCKMIISKLGEPDPNTDVEGNDLDVDAIAGNRSSDDGVVAIEEESHGIDIGDDSEGGRTTEKEVGNTEEEAGGWMNWFRGHFRKYRNFGLPLNVTKTVKLSNDKFKKISLKWSNKIHRNRILVLWENEEKENDEKSGDTVAIEEAVNIPNENKTGEIVMFEFWDDQINPNSPSYVNPSVKFLLESANKNSNLIKKIKDSNELNAIESKYSVPLFKSLLGGVEQKWTEYKGIKEDPEKIKFIFDPNEKSIKFNNRDGKPQVFKLDVISSILSGKNPEDINLIETGKDFGQFVMALKNAGFDPNILKREDAKENYNEAVKANGNVDIKPAEVDIFEIPNIQNAVKALLTLNKCKNEKEAREYIKLVVDANGTGLSTEEYVRKALKEPTPVDTGTPVNPPPSNIREPEIKNKPTSPSKPSNVSYSTFAEKAISKFPEIKTIIDRKLKDGIDKGTLDTVLSKIANLNSKADITKYASDLDKLTEHYKLINLLK